MPTILFLLALSNVAGTANAHEPPAPSDVVVNTPDCDPNLSQFDITLDVTAKAGNIVDAAWTEGAKQSVSEAERDCFLPKFIEHYNQQVFTMDGQPVHMLKDGATTAWNWKVEFSIQPVK
jgi:hypothetical protein